MRQFVVVWILLFTLPLQSCSVLMAARQPGRRDVGLFREGTSRSRLIAVFGTPVASEERNGKKVDIFTFKQGYGTGAKIGRTLFHAAADVFTAFLWELVGTPTELVFDGREISYEVTYDADLRVESAEALQ